QLAQEIPDRKPKGGGTLPDLERRKGVDVNGRANRLDRPADRQIGAAVVVGMNAALQTDLDRTAIPGLHRAALNLLQGQIVWPAAQILAQLAFREGAELTAIAANIRVIDVAGDHVGDDVAANRVPQRIGGRAKRMETLAPARKQGDDLVLA